MAYTCTASLITITNEANVTCQSICDACAQVTKQGTLQFVSTANWSFVNSHFKDTNKQIHFNLSDGYIYVNISSSFQLGDKDGDGNVYNGCALRFNSCQTSFWSTGAAGTIKLYDSFLALSGAFFRCYSGASQVFEMIGCIVQRGSGGRIQGATSILKNLYLHDFTNYAYGSKGAGVTFDNIFINRSAYAMYYSPTSGENHNCTVKGLTGRNNTTGFRLTLGSPGNLFMVNPDIDVWSFTWNSFPGKIYRQYTFDLQVIDKDNNEIGDAIVTIKDKNDKVVSYADSEANLNEDLTAAETGVNVTDGTKFAVNDIIRIYAEYMKVTGIASNTLTVERNTYGGGYFATEHKNGADIFIVKNIETINTGGDKGKITEQTISYGYYNLTNGVTLQNYSPHTLEIKKAGYQTYKKKFTCDEKIDWRIRLRKIKEVNLSKRARINM